MIKSLQLIYDQDDRLRQYQIDSKAKIFTAWSASRSILFQMPTGTGKTRLFASIIKDIRRISVEKRIIPQPKVLVLAHRSELIDQISDTLENRYHISCGIIKSGVKENRTAIVQVASVQSLTRRINKWTDFQFKFIIIDEAHHALAKTYMKICMAYPQAYILGVTATPYRLSGESFRKLFNRLITSMPVHNFIEQGYLSPFRYYSIKPESSLQQSINNISSFGVDGDYSEKAIMDICDHNTIRAKLVKAYLQYAKGKKGIIYTINKKHNQNVADQYTKLGLHVAAIDADTPPSERKKAVNDFKNGSIDIICNVNIFSEGFDCPDLEFIQLARPTQSLSLYLQQVGRALRISENKTQAIILDNVGLYNKFGLPNKVINWQKYFNFSDSNLPQTTTQPASSDNSERESKVNESDEDMMLITEMAPQEEEEIPSAKYELLTSIETMEQYPIGIQGDDCFQSFRDSFIASEYDSLDDYISDIETFADTDNIEVNITNKRVINTTFRYQVNGKYGICRLKEPYRDLKEVYTEISKAQSPQFYDFFNNVLEPKFDSIGIPNTSQLIICQQNKKYGIYDGYTDTEFIPFSYDNIKGCSLGYIIERQNKVGIIKYDNTWLLPIKYDDIIVFNRYYICLRDGKYIIYINSREIERLDCIGNLTGRFYISKIYDDSTNNNLYAITNIDGEIILPLLADFIFLTEKKNEICFEYRSRHMIIDYNFNVIKPVTAGTYPNRKSLLPDFYRKKKQERKKERIHISDQNSTKTDDKTENRTIDNINQETSAPAPIRKKRPRIFRTINK